jgi:hypothetical protein
MARPPSIRITENDRKNFAKLAKNAKAKVRRTLKNYGIDLSREVDIPDLESFKTRKEFNEWKEKIGSFTNRHNQNYQFIKNEHGVAISKARKNKIERNIKKVQREVEKEQKRRENMPFISGGKVQGTVGQRMLQMARPTDLHKPKDFDFSKIKDYQRLHEIEKNFERKSDPSRRDTRAEKMRDIFIETLERTFNSDADDLIEKLREMSGSDFYDMYQIVDEFDFDYYDPSPQDDFDGQMIDEGQKLRELRKLEKGYEMYIRGDYPSLKDF